MLFEIIVACIVFLLIKKMLQRKSEFDPPVGSNKLPLIGHLHFIIGNTAVGIWETIKKISIESLEKGGVLTYHIGLRTFYVVTDPEDCWTIANTCLKKDDLYNFAKNFVGISLFTADAELWKIKRKLLNPAFNVKVLNSFIDIFNEQAKQLTDRLTTDAPFKIGECFQLCSLETICMSSFGSDFQENKTIQKNYVQWQLEIMEIYIQRFLKFWLHQDFVYYFSSLKKKEDEVVQKMHSLSNSIIQRKKKMMAIERQEETLNRVKPFMDLILELVRDTGCFTDDEVRGETDTFISGGHETSGIALTYAFIMMGTYPAIQKKIYEEILQVIGNEDRDVNKDDLVKLVYIDAVLKETLRLFPVAPVLARSIDKDVKLKNHTLRAGSTCILSIWGVHRHPVWGSDAEQYRPERWLSPDTLPNVNYFGGFSIGKRSCIGKGYAMMFMKTVIAHVIRRYRVTADISNVKFKIDVTLKPESGHYVTLEQRE